MKLDVLRGKIHMKFFNLVVIILGLSTNGFCAESWLEGKVMNIVDGDTIKVKLDVGRELAVTLSYVDFSESLEKTLTTIRLSQIDAPELKQKNGPMIVQYLRRKILFKSVRIIESGTSGTAGLMNAQVWYEFEKGKTWKNINEEMVEDGMAWVDKFSFDEDLKRIEIKAQKDKKGIFQEDNPMPPWMFRSKRKKMEHKIPIFSDCTKKSHKVCGTLQNCTEALYLLNTCLRTDLDIDRDGIPCERTICSNRINYQATFDTEKDD